MIPYLQKGDRPTVNYYNEIKDVVNHVDMTSVEVGARYDNFFTAKITGKMAFDLDSGYSGIYTTGYAWERVLPNRYSGDYYGEWIYYSPDSGWISGDSGYNLAIPINGNGGHESGDIVGMFLLDNNSLYVDGFCYGFIDRPLGTAMVKLDRPSSVRYGTGKYRGELITGVVDKQWTVWGNLSPPFDGSGVSGNLSIGGTYWGPTSGTDALVINLDENSLSLPAPSGSGQYPFHHLHDNTYHFGKIMGYVEAPVTDYYSGSGLWPVIVINGGPKAYEPFVVSLSGLSGHSGSGGASSNIKYKVFDMAGSSVLDEETYAVGNIRPLMTITMGYGYGTGFFDSAGEFKLLTDNWTVTTTTCSGT
jgi:hypothetical protein